MTVWNRTAAAALFALLSGFVSGQTNGRPAIGVVRISGRIVDATDAPIQDAAVRLRLAAPAGSQRLAGETACPTTLTSASPGTTLVVFTSQDGTFSFPAQLRQTYELNVESAGFRTVVKTIPVGTDVEFKLEDIVLPVGRSSGVLVEGTLIVQGIGGTSATLSAADLAGLPQQTVRATDHGTPVAFQGVLLADVLSKVAVPTGEVQIVAGTAGVSCHSTAALYELLARGRDGYQAVFAWAELDARFTDRPVYLVTHRDGQPLPDKDGPFQLVAPGEKSAARWVRQVTALTIKRAT